MGRSNGNLLEVAARNFTLPKLEDTNDAHFFTAKVLRWDSSDRWRDIILMMYVGATEDTAVMAREDKTTSSSKASIVRVFREYYDPRVLTVRTWSILN